VLFIVAPRPPLKTVSAAVAALTPDRCVISDYHNDAGPL